MNEKRGIDILVILYIIILLMLVIIVVYGVGLFKPQSGDVSIAKVPDCGTGNLVRSTIDPETVGVHGVFVNPVGNVTKGTPTTRISGLTSNIVGGDVEVDILCDDYCMTPAVGKSGNPAPYDRHAVARVVGMEGVFTLSVMTARISVISPIPHTISNIRPIQRFHN